VSLANCFDFMREYSNRALQFSFDGVALMISIAPYHVVIDFRNRIKHFQVYPNKYNFQRVLHSYENQKLFFMSVNEATQMNALI